jgi:hypothetical protein
MLINNKLLIYGIPLLHVNYFVFILAVQNQYNYEIISFTFQRISKITK